MKNAQQFQPSNLSAQYRCDRCWTSDNINLYPKSQFLKGDFAGFVILCNKCKCEAPIGVIREIFEHLFLRFASPKDLINHYNARNEEEAMKMWCKEYKVENTDYKTEEEEVPQEIEEVEKNEEIAAPFGYEDVAGKILVNQKDADVIIDIYQKYLDGNTMERIARSLDCDAVLHTLKVREILKNPVYAGYTFKGQDLVKGPQEAIIDGKTFNSVQLRILRNIRNPKYMYKPLELRD